MDWIFVESFENDTNQQTSLLSCDGFLVGRFSKIIHSKFEGPGEIDEFSCINRSTLGLGAGIGVSSYVSDAVIGRHTMIGSRVSIGGFEHPMSWLSVAPFQWGQSIEKFGVSEEFSRVLRNRDKPEYRPTLIGCDVWIGNNCVIKAGVSVGHGAVIGAGAVVTKDIEAYEVHVGNPAKFLKHRFSENQISALLDLKWWELDLKQIGTLDFKDIDKCIASLYKIKQAKLF